MRYLIILVITWCVLSCGLGRPAKDAVNNEPEVEEAEYEGGGEGPDDDSAVRENDAPMNNAQQEQVADADQEEGEESQSEAEHQTANENPSALRATDDERPSDKHFKFSDYKSGGKSDSQDEKPDSALDTSNQYETQSKRNLSPFGENPNERRDEPQRIANRDANDFKLIRNNEANRRAFSSQTTPVEEGRLLFESIQTAPDKNDKHAYNGVPLESNEHNDQPRYFKQYYNEKKQDKGRKFHRFHLNRDRRNAEQDQKESNSVSSAAPNTQELGDISSEDEEEAIKRHVKKLSDEELQELLNSLSDEKKELLKRIMGGGDISDKDNINKREITKKAGTLQENSNIDSGQADMSKLQESGSVGTITDSSPSSPSPSSTKAPEATEINELAVTKTSEAPKGSTMPDTSSNIDLSAQASDENNVNAASAVNTNSVTSNNQAVAETKSAVKREANLDTVSNDDATIMENESEVSNLEGSDNQEDFSSQDEDFSQLMKNESQLHEENKNMFKRQACENGDFSDSIRSLEESFPKPNTYDESDPYSGTDLAPLVRVKRKNTDIVLKKGGAALHPEAKVAYFPYRAENDDEDNDEGSEFDDEGFYDRNSNLAKNVDDTPVKSAREPAARPNRINKMRAQSKNSDASSENDNIEGDTSIGSDTDSVLSGVEGVDDNLMFSSGTRNRRDSIRTGRHKSNSNAEQIENNESNSRPQRSTPFIEDEMKTATENLINAPNLAVESDAFGALPRSYDGELGRYKRVRRVKQQQDNLTNK